MDIDIVIPWVDGSDPRHAEKRNQYIQQEAEDGSRLQRGELTNSLRWDDFNELNLALWSVEKHAPWIRKIWMVTDEQKPDLSQLSVPLQEKIGVVDHKVIFSGYEDCLPTFNSASIEAMVWRIPGIAEHAILFNDDIFFLKDTGPEYFFREGKLVFRGAFNGGLLEPGLMWSFHRLNGALLAGFPQYKMLTLGHICQPIRVSVLADFFAKNEPVLRNSVQHKIRHRKQFLLTSLMAHLALKQEMAEVNSKKDWHYVPASLCERGSPEQIAQSFMKFQTDGIQVGNVNNMRSACDKIPFAYDFIKEMVSG